MCAQSFWDGLSLSGSPALDAGLGTANQALADCSDIAAATQAWGAEIYAAIPKSVFALIAFHLANLASGECDNPGAAEKRFIEEWDALIPHGLSEPAKKLRAALLTRAA